VKQCTKPALLAAAVFLATFNAVAGPKANAKIMTTDHIAASLDEMPCEVYFFEGWTSYSHPVTPVRPLFLEQALRRSKYQRAWMCADQGAQRFVLLETVENHASTIELQSGAVTTTDAVKAFEASSALGSTALGRPLQLGETIAAKEFIAALPGNEANTLKVSQKVISSFRYRYKADGALASVTMINPEGKTNVLEY